MTIKQRNLKILCDLIPLANYITKKKIVCNSKKTLRQDESNIYVNHWLELTHEISHYLVATDDERKDPNLGFKDIDITEHNLIQESKASNLNREINQIIGFEFQIEKDYSDHIFLINTKRGFDPSFIRTKEINSFQKKLRTIYEKRKNRKCFTNGKFSDTVEF
jgi:hypothetical protein